ncbi:GIY-YIG nuclease family protein [Candidatus Parcubacteria bacterium]|jgi:putative endonuclease|nr:GIY-YIG nuclease family protein [Candidatus Parcubacteria bacterium]MBT7228582.1 GIY-YIG nuclease family protein [Candidatus Parcubacteria bacterium]
MISNEVRQKNNWYVYIIECLDSLYYVGMTNDLSKRYDQHLSGLGSKFTAKHGIKQIVYVELYEDFECARYREKQIKNWNRSKKEKLIKGKWGKIQ